MKMMFFTLSILSLLISHTYSAGVVCSIEELAKELKEDLADNGKLDCLRESLPSPGETKTQEELRLAAMWTSDCSFEYTGPEENHWKNALASNYNFYKGLVNVEGEPVAEDFEDQADMCEIVRALIANGNFPGISEDITSINENIITMIDCPGSPGQTNACAANARSFADGKGWIIFLHGKSVTFNEQPQYEVKKGSPAATN